jgi:2,4-dienoyl-CoA reductase-like NADH-dependent reductase (Old Yellow Enzyme family)
MSILFESIKIKDMDLRNRFVRSATGESCADESGHVTENLIRIHQELAEGGVGLIVMGITFVHPSGRVSPRQSGLADDGAVPGLKRLVEAVHARGSKIAVQLFHAGRESARVLNPSGKIALAPSLISDDAVFQGEHRALTEGEIREIVGAFGDAAKRAVEAGIDAVQLHAAHGYLPSQFLSPHTNRRRDDWGGDLGGRLRFHREIAADIKKKAGPDIPLLVKLGVRDEGPNGLRLEEGVEAARKLAEWGYDGIEVSQGLRGKGYAETEFRMQIKRTDQEGYFGEWTRAVKDVVSVPTMVVGGLRSFERMEEIVESGGSDFVSMSRPLIREPGLVKAWQEGGRDRAKCISCNQCLEAIRAGESLHCVQEREKGEEISK